MSETEIRKEGNKNLWLILGIVGVIILILSVVGVLVLRNFFPGGFLSKKGCEYNGVEYNEGETFEAGDGCNTCLCENGEYYCTEMACDNGGNENCVDQCGDGVCDEVTCDAIGCPCSETPDSCPEDCGDDADSVFNDWNTYENSVLGIRFKYPDGWEIDGRPLHTFEESEEKEFTEYNEEEIDYVEVRNNGKSVSYYTRSDVPILCKFEDSADPIGDEVIYDWELAGIVEMEVDFTDASYTEVVANNNETVYRIIRGEENWDGLICVSDGREIFIESSINISKGDESEIEILKTFELL